jgi:luciferase family oxidoreductase group 1
MVSAVSQPLTLGVVDLCKRSANQSAKQALEETLALAELTDSLGYNRFWVGEHHVADTAAACPEIMVGLLASRTKHIRLGTGGVLLRYYSPIKVAENFLTLEALFPGRIDLGVCKGPGALQHTAEALVSGNAWELGDEVFDNKVTELIDYFRRSPSHKPAKQDVANAYPWGVTPPTTWVLGSGTKSQKLASKLGTPYCFTLFFDSRQTYGPVLIDQYRTEFTPSPEHTEPASSIAVSMVCLENEIEALALEARSVGEGNLPSTIVGSPLRCIERLYELAEQYKTNEILVATWMGSFEDRANLYRWLAEYNQSGALAYDEQRTSVTVQ